MSNFVYIIRNKINSKVYIGITSRTLEKRFKQHLQLAKRGERFQLYKAIREYGKENFYIEQICECKTKEASKKLEKFYINKFDSFEKGYNMTIGGSGTDYWLGAKHKESTKLLISKKLRGNSNSKFRKNFVKIEQLDSDGNVISIFDSVKEAAEANDIKSPSDISSYCRGGKKSFSKGFIFRYASRKYKTKKKR